MSKSKRTKKSLPANSQKLSKKDESRSLSKEPTVIYSGVTKERNTLFSIISKKKANKTLKIDSPNVQKQLLYDLDINNMRPEDYIANPVDQPELVFVKPVHMLKGGKGLFARKFISLGTRLGIYTGEVYSSQKDFDKHFEEHPQADNNYTMHVGNQFFVDSVVKGNFTRYINFSDSQSNVKFKEGEHGGSLVAEVIATKDIKKGVQILIDYNAPDEQLSKEYFFLNPEDTELSASDIQKKYSKHYTLVKVDTPIRMLKVKKNDYLYTTEVGNRVLHNELLSELDEDLLKEATIDLPFLRIAKNEVLILDLHKTDIFTPLMLACYMGQFANVQWLVNHEANIDRQQNHSGLSPLFFTLEGYAQEKKPNRKKEYFNILQFLIRNKANIFTHDRENMFFFHKAILVLSDPDFKTIMTLIRKLGTGFTKLFDYRLLDDLEENSCDIILYCIKKEELSKLKTLLDLHPDYFQEKNNQISLKDFQLAFEELQDEFKVKLYNLLNQKKYNVPLELLEKLNLSEEKSECMEIASNSII